MIGLKNVIIRLIDSVLYRGGVIIGHNSYVYPNVSIQSASANSIRIGDNCRIGSFSRGYRIGPFVKTRLTTIGKSAKIIIGNNCKLSGANICVRSTVEIGDNGHLAAGTIITDINGHKTYSFSRDEPDSPKPVIIGNNVWIGLNSIILKGTVIGDNSIVSAGSVVKGEFPPFSLISGNPAKVIKTLDKEKFK